MELTEALNKQTYLFKQKCENCPHRIGYKYSDECHVCPVKKEMLEIGDVLLQITHEKRKRKVN